MNGALLKLRMGLKKSNFKKINHNFKDTINPLFPTSEGIEDTELLPSLMFNNKNFSSEL